MKLEGKVILITGAARRIGKAIALSTARQGACVAVHYHQSKSTANHLVASIRKEGGIACSVQGDLRNVADCGRIVEETLRQFKRLDILINNASVFFKTPFFKVGENEWDHIFDANLKGPFFCAQAASKGMQEQGGKIINIADWAAIRPYTQYLPYCISKAGLIAMTRGLARTLAPKITVNAIAPGPILPPEDGTGQEMDAVIQNTPLKRFGSPEDIVNTTRFLIEGGDFMTGATIMVDGGRHIA